MPELPEVETLVNELKPEVTGKTILNIRIFRSLPIAPLQPKAFKAMIESKKITAVTRRAKYIIFHLRPKCFLLTHLRMTGTFILAPPSYLPDHHDRVVFYLEDENKLVFQDIRCLGKMEVVNELTGHFRLNRLGPEPLSRQFNLSFFRKCCRSTAGSIKGMLMDQNKIAGIGNIYASEILFKAAVHPERPAETLTDREQKQIVQSVKQILRKAIARQGTSISDFRRTNNKPGGFQNFLNVYQKAGRPCPTCGRPIRRIIQNQRSSFFCRQCQH